MTTAEVKESVSYKDRVEAAADLADKNPRGAMKDMQALLEEDVLEGELRGQALTIIAWGMASYILDPNVVFPMLEEAADCGYGNALAIKAGILWREFGDLESAADCYHEALERGFDTPKIRLEYGWLLERFERYDEALDCFDRLIELGDDKGYAEAAGVYMRMDEHDRATMYYERGLEQNCTRCMLEFGNLLEYNEEYDRAEALFLQGLAIDDEFGHFAYALAKLYRTQGRLDEARIYALANRERTRYPENWKMWFEDLFPNGVTEFEV